MATTYARMRQIIGTTGEWTADNIILAVGELGIEKASGSVIRIRVGDGVLPFLSLPVVSGDADITAVLTPGGSGLTGGASSGSVTLGIDFTVVAPLNSPVFTATAGAPSRSTDLSLGAVANELATAKFVKNQGFLTAGTAAYLPLAGGTMTSTGNITGFNTNSTLNFGKLIIASTSTFGGLVSVTALDNVTAMLIKGTARGIRFSNSTSSGLIDGRDETDAAYMPLGIGGTEVRFNLSGAEGARLTTTGFGIGATPAYKLDVQANTDGIMTARFYNLSIGDAARTTLQLNAGGRYTNLSADYQGAYVLESASGLTKRYVDYDTHYWRDNAAGTMMMLTASTLTLYGPAGANYGTLQHTDSHLYLKAVNATGNLYLGGNNINLVGVTGAALIPVTTKVPTLGDATHIWNGLWTTALNVYGATSGVVNVIAPATVTAGVTVTLPNFSGTVALLQGPVFTGQPTTPPPSVSAPDNTNNLTIANTAFVQSHVAGSYAPINNPVFTGDAQTQTTPPELDSDDTIPNTDWVDTYFLRLKGGSLTGTLNTNSLINSTVAAGSVAMTALGIVRAGQIESEVATDAKVVWNATGNVANARLWYARQMTSNVLRLTRMTDALVENTTTAFDFKVDGNIQLGTAAPQVKGTTGKILATFDFVNSTAGDYLPLVGGTITGTPGTLTVTGNVTLATGGSSVVSVPLPVPTSNSSTTPATTKWIRDLLLNRAGAIAQYQKTAAGAVSPAPAVDPKNGKYATESLGTENGFAKYRITMSTKDYDGNLRYLLALLPGDSLVGTDALGAPITGFTRYVVVTKPVQVAGSALTVGEPGYPGTNAPFVYFNAFQIELSGTQPADGNVIVVTGYLNSATGDGPITGIDAGKNLGTGASGGSSGVVTLHLDANVNTRSILLDPQMPATPADALGPLAGQIALDAVDLGPVNTTTAGGRMRFRAAPTAVSAKDFVMDMSGETFRWLTYPKGTASGGMSLGTVDLALGSLSWYRGGVTFYRSGEAGTVLKIGDSNNVKHWQVTPEVSTNVAEVGYLTTAPSTWSLTRYMGDAEFQADTTVMGRLGVGAAGGYPLDVQATINGSLVSRLYNLSTGASADTNLHQRVGASSLHRILTQTTLREYGSAAITVRYSDFALQSFRNASGVNGIDIEGKTIKFYGATSGTSVLQAQAVAGTTTFTLPAVSGTLITSATVDGYLPLAGGELTDTLYITQPGTGYTLVARGSGSGSGKAVRMYHTTTRSYINGVDWTGTASYQPLTIRAAPDLQLYGDPAGQMLLSSAGAEITGNASVSGTLTGSGNIVTDGGYLHVHRGTATVGTSAYLYLDSAAPQNVTGALSVIWFRTGSSNRWYLGKSSNVETGTPVDSGSNFILYSFTDGGANKGTALYFERDTRNFGINTNAPTNAVQVNVSSYAGTPARGLTLHNTSSGAAWVANEVNTAIDFSDADGDGAGAGTRIRIGSAMNAGSGSYSSLVFQTAPGVGLADTGLVPQIMITHSGSLYLNSTYQNSITAAPKLYIYGNFGRLAPPVAFIQIDPATVTDTTGTASVVSASRYGTLFGIPTFASTGLTNTITTVATVRIDGAPVAGTNVTVTNTPYALYIAGGAVYMNSHVTGVGNLTMSGALTATGNVTAAGGIFTTATIAHPTSNGAMNIDADTAAKYSIVYFKSEGLVRWYMGRNATAEAGSNAGSDFQLSAYADNGSTNLGTAYIIRRSSRIVEFTVTPTAPTVATADDSLSVATTAYVKNQGYQVVQLGHFMAVRTTALSLTATLTALVLNSVTAANSGTWYSTSTGRFTPPAGRYYITGSMTVFNSGGTSGSVILELRKNGSASYLNASTVTTPASISAQLSVCAVVDGNGTDYFALWANTAASVGQVSFLQFSAFPI